LTKDPHAPAGTFHIVVLLSLRENPDVLRTLPHELQRTKANNAAAMPITHRFRSVTLDFRFCETDSDIEALVSKLNKAQASGRLHRIFLGKGWTSTQSVSTLRLAWSPLSGPPRRKFGMSMSGSRLRNRIAKKARSHQGIPPDQAGRSVRVSFQWEGC
jgi:hypothetical protein